MSRKSLKILGVAIGLGVATAVSGSQIVGALFPILQISTGILIILVLSATISELISVKSALYLTIILSITVRIVIVGSPFGLLATDPGRYAAFVDTVLSRGGLRGLDVRFYRQVPLFLILIAQLRVTTILSSAGAYIVLAGVLGLLFPLASYRLTAEFDSKTTAVVAAQLSAIAAGLITYTWRLIPQTIAVVFLLLLVHCVIRLDRVREVKFVTLIFLFSAALTYTHKLSVFAGALILLSIPTIAASRHPTEVRSVITEHKTTIRLASVLTLLTVIQWAILTPFFSSVVSRLFTLFVGVDFAAAPPQVTAVAATRVADGLKGFLYRRMHGLVLLPLAGLGWIYVWVLDEDRYHPLLGATAILTTLTVIGAVSLSTINPVRSYILVELFLCILIAVSIGKIIRVRSRLRPVIWVILVLVVSSQVGAAYWVPDSPDTRRQYMTVQEHQGIEFGGTYSEGVITTDSYYAERARRDDNGEWTGAPGHLINATVVGNATKLVAIRQNVKTYRFYYEYRGRWQLTYNPETRYDKHYNRIYSNGEVVFYANE